MLVPPADEPVGPHKPVQEKGQPFPSRCRSRSALIGIAYPSLMGRLGDIVTSGRGGIHPDHLADGFSSSRPTRIPGPHGRAGLDQPAQILAPTRACSFDAPPGRAQWRGATSSICLFKLSGSQSPAAIAVPFSDSATASSGAGCRMSSNRNDPGWVAGRIGLKKLPCA
jgi:hypothetical protein